MFKLTFAAIPACIATLILCAGAQAQQPRTNAGTLTCTLGPGKIDEVREPRNLSCIFKAVAGPQAKYTGLVKRLRDPAVTADTLVLVWIVLAPDAGVQVKSLEGKYIGVIDGDAGTAGQPVGRLIGGAEASIELRPFTRLPDDGPDDTSLVLELDLKSIRA